MANYSDGIFESAAQNTDNRRKWIIIGCAALAILGCVCLGVIGLGAAIMQASGTLGASDLMDTTQVETIAVGSEATGLISATTEAHNYLFEGSAGQLVTIQVIGDGFSDPRARLIGPDGKVVARDDDSGGGLDAFMSVTLNQTGTYTIRIDMITPGEYTLILQ